MHVGIRALLALCNTICNAFVKVGISPAQLTGRIDFKVIHPFEILKNPLTAVPRQHHASGFLLLFGAEREWR